MKLKKKWFIIFFILLLCISLTSIGVGIYFNRLATPQHIMGEMIDQVGLGIENVWDGYRDFFIGNDMTMDSTIQLHFDSEELFQKSTTDMEAAKSYQILKNINQSQNHLVVMRDTKKGKALISLQQKLGQEDLVDAKYVIDNSTKYYYVKQVLQNYVDDGSCNYFESLNIENTSSDNIEYIYSVIKESLKKSLKNEYFRVYTTDQNIKGSNRSVHQISLKLSDKVIRNIFNDILRDLKADNKAKQILSGIDGNFSKMKVSDKQVFLGKNETYTFNIYTTKHLYKPLKYEIIHLDGDNLDSINYEGNRSKGDLYIIHNDAVKYRIEASYKDKVDEFIIFDSKDDKIGKLKYENSGSGLSIDWNFDDSTDKYSFVYSSKFSNIKAKKSYQKHTEISYKHVHNKIGVLSGDVYIDTTMKNEAKIEEDVSNAILASSLTEEQKQKFNDYPMTILERLER